MARVGGPPKPRSAVYLFREPLSRNAFMALGISPELSTGSKSAFTRPASVEHAGCMTQNLSPGAHAPHDDPRAPATGVARASQPHRETPAKKQARTPQARTPKSWRKPPAPRTSARRADSPTRPAARVEPDARTTADRRVRIGSPPALLAVVPVLLGFEPGNSIVVMGTDSPRAQVRLTLRYDLPDPRLAAEVARHAAGVLAAQRIRTAVAVGYGPDHLVSPVADALRDWASRAGITVTELLRAQEQRYWSYLCTEPSCCPPEGTPFDIKDHPAARAMAAEGVQVLASRDELAATVAPVTGDAAEEMHRATRKAEEHIARCIARAARSGRKASVRRAILTAGLPAVSEAIARYRAGGSLEPEKVAWLTVVLRDLRVRDDAWSRMQPEHREAHRRLWTDLSRMARPGYVPAPASLLAFVAWQSGNGALANVALDRALADDPSYSMAMLLRQAIDAGAPPSLARLPMTPEEVAASYDGMETGDEGDEHHEDDADLGESGGRQDGQNGRGGAVAATGAASQVNRDEGGLR